MCGWIGKGILARAPIRPYSAWKALGAIGPSRSVMKTCEDGPCSRCRRRSARISSPCIGWTLGEPFFALRTCSRPVASSTYRAQRVACRELKIVHEIVHLAPMSADEISEDEPVLIEWREVREANGSGGPNADTARTNVSFDDARRYAVIAGQLFRGRESFRPA